ncbi:MAG: DUF2179 domain-containing protein [Candidatus Aminicenantes bacterium]|jgi:uncharacterized protein YebE (UPF0316 family)
MNLESVVGSDVFRWIILPLLIFSARILDVSLGTIRIVFVSKSLKFLAPAVGFVEVIIWLLTLRVIMQNLNNFACYIAYGAGFALGTFIGLQIEKRIAIGNSVFRIITQDDATELIGRLRSDGYGVTSMKAQGIKGEVNVIYMIIKREDFKKVTQIIKQFNPKAFFTVEDACLVSAGTFPARRTHLSHLPLIGTFRFWRKGK